MKNIIKKIGITALSLIGITFLASCGGNEVPPKLGEMNDPELPNFAATPSDKNSWEYIDENTDLTIHWYVDVSTWNAPTGLDSISQKIKEDTGIDVIFDTPVDDSGTKLATMIAGGNLPDVVTIATSKQEQIAQLSQQGYIYPINDLADKWAPSLYDNLPEDVLSWWAYGNGKTYGIPNHYYSYDDVGEEKLQPNGGLMVRTDLYEAWQTHSLTLASGDGMIHYTSLKGIEKTIAPQEYITTPEGFKAACLWALENYKGTSAGKITTGLELAQFKNDGCVSLTWLAQFFAVPFEDSNGQLIYQFTSEAYKDMLSYLNDLYLCGVISTANFTANYDGVGGVIASASAFATLVTPQDYQFHFLTAQGSGYPYESLFITNSDGDAPILADIRGYGYLYNMITTGCSRPDLVIKLFDYLTSTQGQLLVTLGVEGVTWNYTDDTRNAVSFTQEYLDKKANLTDSSYGLMFWDLLINYQRYDNWQPKTNNGKTEGELYRTNLKRPLSIYTYDLNAMNFVIDVTDKRYATYNSNNTRILQLIGQQLPKLIKASSKSQFNTIYTQTVNGMNQRGLELVYTMQNEAFQRAKTKLGLEFAWPAYNSKVTVTPPDRSHPNGDLSLYRTY